MSDCISVGLTGHNFRGLDEMCIDCGVKLRPFILVQLVEAIRADREKLAGLVELIPFSSSDPYCVNILASMQSEAIRVIRNAPIGDEK